MREGQYDAVGLAVATQGTAVVLVDKAGRLHH